MRHRSRAVQALSIAIVALAAGAASAPASGPWPDIINTPQTTMIANNATIQINRPPNAPLIATCQQIRVIANIFVGGGPLAGTVTIPPGNVMFANCTAGGIAIAVNQGNAWTGVFRHLDIDVPWTIPAFTLDLDIPMGGIRVAAPLGCAFDMGGTPLGEHVFRVPVPHNVLQNIPTLTFPAALDDNPLDLVTGNVAAACGLFGVANGQLAQLTAMFGLNPVVNGMG